MWFSLNRHKKKIKILSLILYKLTLSLMLQALGITICNVLLSGLYLYPLLHHLSEKMSHALLRGLLGVAE